MCRAMGGRVKLGATIVRIPMVLRPVLGIQLHPYMGLRTAKLGLFASEKLVKDAEGLDYPPYDLASAVQGDEVASEGFRSHKR